MRGGRLLGFAIVLLTAGASFAQNIALQLTPAEPVKGRDTEAALEIVIGGVDRPAPPVLRASVGSIDRIERTGPGRFRARFVLPATRAPEVAIIVAFAPWPHPQSVEGAFGVLRVPMASAVEVPGRAEPGAEVRLTLGAQTFGPVRASGDGSFRLPVVVPPGYGVGKTITVDRVGNRRSTTLDLLLPRVDQLACVATPTTLPADGVSKARVLCASSDKFGAATKGAKVQWKAGRGAWSSARELGDGVQEWTWTAPKELGAGSETLLATWKQGAVDSNEALSLTLSQGPVRTLEVEGEDRVVHQGSTWAVRVRASDQLGRPLAGALVTASGFEAATTDAEGVAALRWKVPTTEAPGARELVVFAAGPWGREPARLLVWKEGAARVAQVVDLSGLPVPNQKLQSGASIVTTGADGTARLGADARELTHAEWPGIRAEASSPNGAEARITVVVVPAPPVNIRVARAAADFEWWLETGDGELVDGREVEIRAGSGSRRAVSQGKSREQYGAGLVSITDVASRVTAVVERAP